MVNPRARFDAIGTVEACYRPVADTRQWLRGILDALAPLDAGAGRYAKTYRVRAPGDFRLETFVEHGAERLSGAAGELSALIGAEAFARIHDPHPPVALLSHRLRPFPEPSRRHLANMFQRLGIGDVLGILAGDHDGCGVLVGLLTRPGGSPSPRILHRLRQVAAHLVAARRLRAQAEGRAPAPADALTDAVLEPSGAVADARGAASASSALGLLRAAIRRLDRARGRLRHTDPDEALSLWQGLVDGTWSLVEFLDTDGRRFMLARRNPPEVADPRALNPRERSIAAYVAAGHSNKYIGYLLGLAPTTVASHLNSIERKLHAGSRCQLIRLLAATRTAAADPGDGGCAKPGSRRRR